MPSSRGAAPHSWLRPIRLLLKRLFRLFVEWGFPSLAVHLIARDVTAVPPSHQERPGADTLTLLAINPDRFRGELEILADVEGLRILKLPFAWSGRLLGFYYPASFNTKAVFNPALQPGIAGTQERFHRFLARLLPPLYRKLGVDGVLSAAVHYIQDADIGAVSDRLGFPYLVLHRENMATAPAHERRFFNYSRELGQFHGSHAIFYNEVVRQQFIASGFLTPEQSSALGCMRMDGFLEQIRHTPPPHRPRPLVVLFSFTHAAGLLGLNYNTDDFVGLWSRKEGAGLVTFFTSVHAAFIALAREHPEADFVIKTKWLPGWKERIEQAATARGIDPSTLANLTITDTVPAQELILEASLIMGYNSTTVLEGGVAKRPVIIPCYHEVDEERYAEYVFLQGHHHLFTMARSEEALKELVRETLAGRGGATIPDCDALFSKLISPVEGGAVDRHARVILAFLRQARERRQNAGRALSAPGSPLR